jgi:hypothetical protein
VGGSLGEQDVRDFLVRSLERRGAKQNETDCAFLAITIATEGHRLQVTTFSHGPLPAPAEWTPVPLADLMMFAAIDLRGG